MSLFVVSLTTVLVTWKPPTRDEMHANLPSTAEGSEKAYEACETTKRKAREAEAWETTKDKASELLTREPRRPQMRERPLRRLPLRELIRLPTLWSMPRRREANKPAHMEEV